MAVVIKTFDAKTVMKKLGVQDSDVQWLTDNHVKTTLLSSELIFEIPSEDYSEVEKQYTVTIGILLMVELKKADLSAGSPQYAKAQVMANQITKVIEEIKVKYGVYLASLPEPPAGWSAPSGTLGKLPPLIKTPMTYAEATKKTISSFPGGNSVQATDAQQIWPTFDLDKIKTAEKVKLRDATMMYQPVHGSSSGSRYFMVGANNNLRVAARLKGGTLSIRIEGQSWDTYKKQIEAVGFSKVSKSEQYASVHLDVGGDDMLANKTLGAILTGLGVDLHTPIPNLKIIS